MSVAELRRSVTGVVVEPGDAEWDAARAFHSGIGEPDLIVRARGIDDVRAAVRHAVRIGAPVVVRGGGHSVWGTLPGGVVVDLAALDAIEVDATTVSVGGGATWGAVARALAPRGLGISSGDTASVGVGGLTLGGGIGWMVRAWGLASDQLIAAQLVTATGEVVTASAQEHPDLFAALRGGGGNFGVVTRFDFAAHALPAVVHAVYAVTADHVGALRRVRELMRRAPRELTVTYMDVPAVDPHAPAGATLTAVWAGADESAARAALAPLTDDGAFTAVQFGVRAYPDILLEMPAVDPAQPAPGFVGGNALVAELDDALIERLVDFRTRYDPAVLLLRSLGGAYGDPAQAQSVFPARDAQWFVMAGAFDIPGLMDDAARDAAQRAWSAVDEVSGGVYGNFTVSTDPAIAARMYAGAAGERLAAVKRAWDPGNVFSRNHNVPPTGADGTL